jgi:hypothetical protein
MVLAYSVGFTNLVAYLVAYSVAYLVGFTNLDAFVSITWFYNANDLDSQ